MPMQIFHQPGSYMFFQLHLWQKGCHSDFLEYHLLKNFYFVTLNHEYLLNNLMEINHAFA